MKIVLGDSEKGVNKAKELLYKYSDGGTVIFLSGGSTPKSLYSKLANEKKLKVGACAMVDERYGLPMHANSNELMIASTGLFKYFVMSNIPVYLTLTSELSLVESANKYNKTIKRLLSRFPKTIAILGVGADGHIASLPPRDSKLKVHKLELVSYIRSFETEPKVPRISLNLNALRLMDLVIVLSFGKDKREGIKKALSYFFKGDILRKTILITDQKIEN